MPSRADFDEAMAGARTPVERLKVLGAFLTRAVGRRGTIVVGGGSAVAVLSDGRSSSADIDVVGPRGLIEAVLRRWGFDRERGDGRIYWTRRDTPLLVDIIHPDPWAGHGRSAVPILISTRYGQLRVSAVEDLIARRLVSWSRGGGSALLAQAVDLYHRFHDRIDVECAGKASSSTG